MLGRDVFRFGDVVFQVVEFNRQRRSFVLGIWLEILADTLPVADADDLLAAVGGELAVQKWPLWL